MLQLVSINVFRDDDFYFNIKIFSSRCYIQADKNKTIKSMYNVFVLLNWDANSLSTRVFLFSIFRHSAVHLASSRHVLSSHSHLHIRRGQYRGESRMIFVGVRFDRITVLAVRIRTDLPEQTV